MDHAPLDRIGTPEQSRRGGEVVSGKGRTHASARDALAVELHRAHHLDLEAEAFAGACERERVARAPRAVAEVFPDDDPASPVVIAQPPVELLGTQRGEARIEALHEGGLDAGLRDAGEPLVKRREPRRRLLGREVLPRQRIESDYSAGESVLTRPGNDALEERRVPAVHAVEASHRDDGRCRCARVARDAHRGSLTVAREVAQPEAHEGERGEIGDAPGEDHQREPGGALGGGDLEP